MAPERKEKLWECDYESFKLCSEIELEYWEAAYLLILSYLYQLIVSFSILTNVLENREKLFLFYKSWYNENIKNMFQSFLSFFKQYSKYIIIGSTNNIMSLNNDQFPIGKKIH